MGKLTERLRTILESALVGSPAEQEEDARLLAERRAANCPSCGDDNRAVITQKLDGGITRPMCATQMDMDGTACGCLHQYHAAVESRCPSCGHADKVLARDLFRWTLQPACPADDGMGGGLEHDGKCGCRHAFHL